MADTMEITDADIDAVLSGADPDAPYGRFKNGKARKRPAGGTAPSVPGPRKTPPRATPTSAKRGQADYAQLSRNALQLPIVALSITGQTLQQLGRQQLGTSLALDGMTIGLYTEQLADVGRRMAEADGWVARWLERFGKGGVYGEAISLGTMIGAQMLVNHGRMQPMPAAGLLPPAELYRQAQAAAGIETPPPADEGAGDGVPGS